MENAIILPIMGMFIPFIAILGGVVIAVMAMKHRLKRNQLEHAERMLAIEKGVQLPPSMIAPASRGNPYIWGLILIGFGLAMMIAMIIEGESDWGWGLIFLLPGLGILAANVLYTRDRKKDENNSIKTAT